MTISEFDTGHFGPDGLTFNGPMCAPGVTACGNSPDGSRWSTPAGNHFGGPLTGQLPNTELPAGARNLSGFALGSFALGSSNFDQNTNAAIPRSVPQGVMGNWGVSNDHYTASGIFGGAHVVQTQ
jgi:hypothetical protein